MLTSASRPLLRADRAVRPRHAVIPHHHVVLDHAEPLRLRILAGARGILVALQVLALRRRTPFAPLSPVSSLFHSAKRIERSVMTSGN